MLLALLAAVQGLQVLVVDQVEVLQVWVDPEVVERLALAAEHLVLLVLVVDLQVEHLALAAELVVVELLVLAVVEGQDQQVVVDLVELLGLEALLVLADQVVEHLVLVHQQDQLDRQEDHREKVLLGRRVRHLRVDHREKDLLD